MDWREEQSLVSEFITAAVHDDTAMASAVLERGLDVNAADRENGQTLLMIARSSPRVFAHLLKLGADIHGRDGFGHDALQLAVADGELHAVRALLHAGASVLTRDRVGYSVLHVAVDPTIDNHAEILELLFRAGAAADLDVPDDRGTTPRELAKILGATLPSG